MFTSKIDIFLVIPQSYGMWRAGSLHLLLFCVLFSYCSKQFKIHKYFSNEKECEYRSSSEKTDHDIINKRLWLLRISL